MSKFYTLCQNNSGGYIIKNEDVDQFVIIEAHNVEHFKQIADKILSGYRRYCSCCGERWDDEYFDESEGYNNVMIYGKQLLDFKDEDWCSNQAKAIIYYLSCHKTTFNLTTRDFIQELVMPTEY